MKKVIVFLVVIVLAVVSVTWDVEPESYIDVNVSGSAIAKHVVDNSKPGSIVLLHVLGSKNQAARNALPGINWSL